MRDKNLPIMFVHQQKHIGGGQTYVDGLKKGVSDLGYNTELVESASLQKIILKLWSSKSRYVVWGVYDRFPLLPFIISRILNKQNILIIFGIWKMESRSLFRDINNSEKLREQKMREMYYLIRQFIFILFSSGVAHLSRYSKNLFYSVNLFRILRNKNSSIIYGGVDKNIFKQIAVKEKIKLREKLGINGKDVILLMVGRIEKRKNYADALNILKRMREKMPERNIFLNIIVSFGNFNDYLSLDSFLKEVNNLNLGPFVRILSGIENKDLPDFYHTADIFLMLSKELETFGLVTLEALISGLPVFGYNECATPEILDNSKVKTLFKIGDFENISKSISKYLKLEEKERQNFVKELSTKANEFIWINSAEKLIKLFK